MNEIKPVKIKSTSTQWEIVYEIDGEEYEEVFTDFTTYCNRVDELKNRSERVFNQMEFDRKLDYLIENLDFQLSVQNEDLIDDLIEIVIECLEGEISIRSWRDRVFFDADELKAILELARKLRINLKDLEQYRKDKARLKED